MRVKLSAKWQKYTINHGSHKISYWIQKHYCGKLTKKITQNIIENFDQFILDENVIINNFDVITWYSGIVIERANRIWLLSPFHGMEVLYVNSKEKIVTDIWLPNKNKMCFDSEAIYLLRTLGFIPGKVTIDKNIKKLIGGAGVAITKSNYDFFKTYPKVGYGTQDVETNNNNLAKLDDVFKKVIQSLKSRCLNKSVYLSLSGGRDSILLACLLKREGLNFKCFTYGPKDNKELINSTEVAKILGLQHLIFETPKKRILNENILLKKTRGFRLPLEPGHHAVEEIFQNTMDKIVIVDGQSGDWLSGGHIQSIPEAVVSLPELQTKHIIKQSLMPNNIDAKDITSQIFSDLEKTNITIFANDADRTFYLSYFVEQHVRQTYLVNTAMRVLENDKLAIESPLWDHDLVNFFASLEVTNLYKQSLYNKYCEIYFPQVFSTFEEKRKVNTSYFFKGIFKICYWILPKRLYHAVRHLGVLVSHYSDQISGFKLEIWWELLKRYPFISEGRTVSQLLTIRLNKKL